MTEKWKVKNLTNWKKPKIPLQFTTKLGYTKKNDWGSKICTKIENSNSAKKSHFIFKIGNAL